MFISSVGNHIMIADPGTFYSDFVSSGLFTWNRKAKCLVAPLSIDSLQTLSRIAGPLPHSLHESLHSLQSLDKKFQEQRNSLSSSVSPDFDYPVKATLMSHQVAGANMAMALFSEPSAGNGFGLLYEMGCGKTLTALAIAGVLFKQGLIKNCLVVAPSTVVPVWRKELAAMADFPFVVGEMLASTKTKRINAYNQLVSDSSDSLHVLSINYNEVFRDGISSLLRDFVSSSPCLMILDEGHYIKNHTASTSKSCCELGSLASYRLLLTGTPISNKNTDVFGLFKFIDSNVFGPNFYAFRNRYCILGGFKGKQVVGVRHSDELTKKMCSASIRVTKADALNLPEETFENRYVLLDAKERSVYDSLRRDSIAELNEGEVSAALIITKMLRMQQVTGGFVHLDDGDCIQVGHSKLDALREIIQDVVFEADQKIVIFARFLPEVNAIKNLCSQLLAPKGFSFSLIHGGIAQEQRGSLVDDFQNNPDCRVFIAQEATAGLGITLHAASTAVFYSCDFSFANYQQATARIHRIGQRHPVTYINIVALDSIDEKVLSALEQKQDLARTLVDDWRKYFI